MDRLPKAHFPHEVDHHPRVPDPRPRPAAHRPCPADLRTRPYPHDPSSCSQLFQFKGRHFCLNHINTFWELRALGIKPAAGPFGSCARSIRDAARPFGSCAHVVPYSTRPFGCCASLFAKARHVVRHAHGIVQHARIAISGTFMRMLPWVCSIDSCRPWAANSRRTAAFLNGCGPCARTRATVILG